MESFIFPPYYPDLNPVEHFWFAIKNSVTKVLPSFWPNISSAIDFDFIALGKTLLA
jgi:transposase